MLIIIKIIERLCVWLVLVCVLVIGGGGWWRRGGWWLGEGYSIPSEREPIQFIFM